MLVRIRRWARIRIIPECVHRNACSSMKLIEYILNRNVTRKCLDFWSCIDLVINPGSDISSLGFMP
jgi:hypothetical protein